MDFEPYFKVHNLASVKPKSIILGQMTNLNMIFQVVVSVYRLLKIWNSPQFPDELSISIYQKYLHYFERLCSHSMVKKTWRHERIILCICDQQVSFGKLCSAPPQQNFSRTLRLILAPSWSRAILPFQLMRLKRHNWQLTNILYLLQSSYNVNCDQCCQADSLVIIVTVILWLEKISYQKIVLSYQILNLEWA